MSEARPSGLIARPQLPSTLTRGRLIAVLRSDDPTQLDTVVDLLVDEGLLAIELALTTPGAIESVRRLQRRLGPEISIGAGTVTTADQAAVAIDVGASFLLAPSLAAEACAYATRQGVPFVPGAFTASEVLSGCEAGAAAIKLFPANLLGPEVIPALNGPIPNVPFIPTGGVDASAAVAWLRRGAVAVGIGGPLLGDALEGGDLVALRERSRSLQEAVRPFCLAEQESFEQSSGHLE